MNSIYRPPKLTQALDNVCYSNLIKYLVPIKILPTKSWNINKITMISAEN